MARCSSSGGRSLQRSSHGGAARVATDLGAVPDRVCVRGRTESCGAMMTRTRCAIRVAVLDPMGVKRHEA